MKHYLLIRSSWSDKDASRYRLVLAEQYLIPSLKVQYDGIHVQVMINPRDPCLDQRTNLFESCGHTVSFVHQDLTELMDNQHDRAVKGWNLPAGRVLTTRCDDDDVLATDFTFRTRQAAEALSDPLAALDWPTGYVLEAEEQERLLSQTTRSGRFLSIVSDDGQCVLDYPAVSWMRRAPRHIVSQDHGWVRLRHKANRSVILRKYLKGCRNSPAPGRWAISLPRGNSE